MLLAHLLDDLRYTSGLYKIKGKWQLRKRLASTQKKNEETNTRNNRLNTEKERVEIAWNKTKKKQAVVVKI